MKLVRHFRTPLRVLAIIILIVLVFYVLITQTSLPEQIASRVFKRMIGSKYNLSLTVGDIGGSLFSNLKLSNLSIHYEKDNKMYLMGSIDSLRLEYSLTDLWRRQWIFKKAYIDRLDAQLYPEVMSRFESSTPGGKKESKTPAFKIDRIILRDCRFALMDTVSPLEITEINLSMAGANSGDSLTVIIDSLSCQVPSHDFALNSFSGHLTLVDTTLQADSVKLNTLESNMFFSSSTKNIEDLDYDVALYESHFNLNRIGRLAGIDLVGELNLTGELSGDPSEITGQIVIDGNLFEKNLRQISANVEFAGGQLAFYNLKGGAFSSRLQGDGLLDFSTSPNQYLFAGRMNNFNLNSLVENTFETSFTGEVIVEGQSFSSDDFMVNLKAELDSGFFDVYSFDSVHGYADVYLDSIVFPDPMVMEKEGATIEAAGRVEYTGDINLFGSGELPDLKPLTDLLQLDYFHGRGRGMFSINGPIEDPALQAEFVSDSVTAYDIFSDSVHVNVDMRRFATTVKGTVDVYSGLFHYNEYDGDSLTALLTLDSNKIFFDSVQVYSKRINSSFSLTTSDFDSLLRIRIPDLHLTFDTFNIANKDTLELIVEDSAVEVRNVSLVSQNGSLNAFGRYGTDGSLDFTVDCNTLNLFPIVGLYAPDQGLQGIADFNSRITGTVADPVFSLSGKIDSLYLQGQKYGNMNFDINYRDSLITVDSLRLYGMVNRSLVSGTIPMNLSFESVDSRLVPDKQMDLAIRSTGTALYLLPIIIPDIEWIEGENQVNIEITGTPDNPVLSGSFMMPSASVKAYYLENVLNNVLVDVSFEGRNIIINRIKAIHKDGNKTGNAELTGTVALDNLFKPTLDLRLTAEDFPFKYDLGDIEGLIDKADLSVYGSDTIWATGEVNLASFKYAEPFEPVIESGALQAIDSANKFNYQVIITAPSNLKVDNQDFNVELGGQLTVIKQGKYQNFLGELETIRGKYYFFDQTFTVLPGGEIQFNNIAEFNPQLNVEVETNITSSGERLKARLLLSGTLNEPKLTATEDSEVGENQFFEYVSFQRVYSGDGSESSPFANRLSVGASEIAIGRVTRYFANKLGVETFEINPGFDGNELDFQSAELRIGMYTTSNLYIYGSAQLDFKRAREVGFEYRFSRRLYLSGQRDEDELYHLNLNLNWEF